MNTLTSDMLTPASYSISSVSSTRARAGAMVFAPAPTG